MSDLTISIRPMSGPEETQWCARLMANSEPWLTLKRDYQEALSIFADPEAEKYLALVDNELAGFVVIIMKGAFTGYIKSIAVAPAYRNQGLGRRLMNFAEQCIFEKQSNAFICVSSFNPDAQRLYERLGYDVIGLLPDFIIPGHGEYLMRKRITPMLEFNSQRDAGVKNKPTDG